MIEIEKLQAGRELDALIAQKVMGIECGASLQDGRLEPITMDWEEVPHYSTDITAAWEIVEKFKMTITPNKTHPRAKWIADIELKGGHDLWLAGAETAPLAICKAALRAIGYDE